MNSSTFPVATPHERAHAVAIAGLLHDVGKVFDAGRVELPEGFREKWEPIVCPFNQRQQQRTHRHALYTAYALDQADLHTADFDVGRIFQLASYHHNPSGDDFDQNILTKADWVASGHDRDEDPDHEEQVVAGLRPPLVSLAWPQGTERTPTDQTLPTLSLDPHPEAFLPRPKPQEAEYRAACRRMADRLLDELKQLESTNPTECIDKLLGILERYLHAVPASRARRHEPDVNLFDHSRLVAAFAACLAVQHETGPCDAIRIQGAYRLATISLGGIQSFITRSIPPMDQQPDATGEKGMAKRLRSRSFYVRMVSWLLARRVVASCGLPPVNVIQDAGGRSMVLLPDTPDMLSQLERALDYARRWFQDELGGLLRLDVAVSDGLTDANFKRENFAQTLRSCDDRLAAARFANPWPHLNGNSGWNDTGWVGGEVSLPVDRKEFLEPLTQFGGKLPKSATVWVEDAGMQTSAADTRRGEINILGYRVNVGERPSSRSQQFALKLNSGDSQATPAIPLLLTANHIPLRDQSLQALLSELGLLEETSDAGDPLNFTEIAALSTDRNGTHLGYSMLGALKADVDHLGMLFGYGLGEKVSFGRYAGAARYLDTFFKGMLDDCIRREFPGIYTVFAGGDDLFLIGPWYDLAHFAGRLQPWFAAAACDNTCVHLSAGLVFAKPTTPVSRLAARAEEALHLAKNAGRNRIAVGQVVLTWQEYLEAFALHQSMVESNRESLGATGSQIYRLLQYAQQAMGLQAKAGRKPAPVELKWRSQMSYDLGRNLPQPTKAGPATNQLRVELQKVLSTQDAGRLYVAASLTLYRLRGKKA